MRFAALSIVVVACLVVAAPAAAHSRAPTVALDYRVRIEPVTLPGVHVDVVDGDRALRVRVDEPHRLLVRGLLGEPLLRFGASGVWVNRASPTAIIPSVRIFARRPPLPSRNSSAPGATAWFIQ